MRAMVNGSSLEECSIIRSSDKIRPYFAGSVVNDPDLIGLLVYLQDSQGNIAGGKVQYTLLAYADETALTEADFQEEAKPIEKEAELIESEEGEPNEEGEPTEPNEADGDEAVESRPVADAKPVEKSANIEIAVESLARELPYFPLPKELEIGPYILVFEAVGKKETLSHTETDVYYLGSAEFNLKDIAMYLPGLSGPQLISPATVIMLEASLDFDSRLDPYVVWYNGKNIISEGKISSGTGQLLWKAPEQAGFFSLRLEAFPFRLNRATYAGLSREIALPVSPKAISLGYFFESNEGYTARSPLSAGTAYPEQARLTATALEEETPPGGVPFGGTPAEGSSRISYPPSELLQWYLFEGSLRNSLSTLTDEQTLLPANVSRPRWAAAGQSYGLAIGPDDPYQLPPLNFFRIEKDQGGGILLFHVRPLSQGVIFSAFFPLKSSLTEGVWMDMIKEGNIIALRLNAADAFVELPIYLTVPATDDLIPIAVEFYIRPYQLEAKISLDENLQNRVGGISLPGSSGARALSGEGRIRLGGVVEKSMQPTLELKHEAAIAALTIDSAEETNDYVPAVVETFTDTVWDELAILFSAVPLLPEGLPVATVSEQNVDANAVQREVADTRSDVEPPISDSEEQETQERSVPERNTLPVLSDNF